MPITRTQCVAGRAEKHSYEAALIAEQERFRLLEERQSFCFEPSFPIPPKLILSGLPRLPDFAFGCFISTSNSLR